MARDGVLTVMGGINLGYAYNGKGEGNRLIVTNGGQVSVSGNSTVGYNFSGDTLLWTGGADPATGKPSFFDWHGKKCMIGYGGQSNNIVVVATGGVMTNANFMVGDDTTSGGNNKPFHSWLIVTNGGYLRGTVSVGVRSHRNTFLVSGTGSRYDAAGALLNVGAGLGNGLVVDGGMATNIVGLRTCRVQQSISFGHGNYAVVTNGGRLFTRGTCEIGETESYVNLVASSNRVEVTGAGSVWDLGGGDLRVGYLTFAQNHGTGNVARVAAGGTITNAGAVTVGYAVAESVARDNRLELAGGTLAANSLQIHPANTLAVEIGPGGLLPARIAGTARLDAGSLLAPRALPGAGPGTYTVLVAGTLADNGLTLDPAADAGRWSFKIDGNVLFLRYKTRGTCLFLR